MKRLVPVVVVAVAVLSAAAPVAAGSDAQSRAASAAPPCIPSSGSSNGHIKVAYCGPATATMTIAGKTYSFKDGYCGKDPTAHIALQMTLGTLVQARTPVNGGDPLFEMTVITESTLTVANVTADSGGKALDSVGTLSVRGSIPQDGTFTSTGFAKPSFTGTWNCHGVVWSH
jgi:hypothetical protein